MFTFPLRFMFSCQLLDMKIFVDTDSDIRLVRRLRRDITGRGRDIEGVIKQYNKFVKPAFEQYIEPTMRLADIVVPRGTCILHTHILKHVYRYIIAYYVFIEQGPCIQINVSQKEKDDLISICSPWAGSHKTINKN